MAVLMRRWLVDGDLQRLVAPLKAPILFPVQSTGPIVAYAAKSDALRYFLTAGVRMNGLPCRFIYDSALEPHEVDRAFTAAEYEQLTLKKSLSQPRLYHDGKWFSTAQILRFVANKLGGKHLDFDRMGEWANGKRLIERTGISNMVGQN